MEVKAITKYVRVQPRKVRIVADEVRGMTAISAAHKLRFHKSKGAQMLRKTLISAMANASENFNLAPEALKIAAITIDEGPRLKRMQARAMGRGNRILKKTSHITVVVEDVEPTAVVKPHGTKAKPRPTLAVKGKKPAKKDAPVEAPVEAAAPVVEETVEETNVAETTTDAEAGTSEEKVEN